MIRVGVLLNFPVEYKGGINYLKNLFFALNRFYADKVEIFLFVPADLDQDYIDLFSPYATIVKTEILKRRTLPWLMSRIGEKYVGCDILARNLLKRHRIEVVTHSSYVFPGSGVASINWIPDFQYLHYPHLWTAKQLRTEHKAHGDWVRKSDLLVVSSGDAFNDFKKLYSDYSDKVRVLHFVSQADGLHQQATTAEKYTISPYFYLPNQFWEHKNHLVVFKAIKILKDRGIDVLLLTSGLMKDYRSKQDHVANLQNFVTQNGLEYHIRFLELIPYRDVLMLIRNAKAVINPSFFEGWSSTVEESKSVNKKIILSDIPVHREQAPANGIYFDPSNEAQLADLLEHVWTAPYTAPDLEIAAADLEKRTRQFADNAYRILTEAKELSQK